jgi:HSP20 family protein
MADIKVQNPSSEQQRNPATTQQQQRGGGVTRWGEYWPSPRDFFANPFGMMRRLSEEMDRAFSTSSGLGREMGSFWPAVEVKEQNGNLVVSADLPGTNKEDVKVEATDEGLVIHGERKRDHEETHGGFHRTERSYGAFYRVIPLPESAQVEKAQAQFKDGVLEIKVPIPESAQHKAREIPIKT